MTPAQEFDARIDRGSPDYLRPAVLVADEFAVNPNDFPTRSRKQPLATARQALALILREQGWPNPRLGHLLNRCGREWVLESRHAIRDKMSVDPGLRDRVDRVRRALQPEAACAR